MITVTIDGRRIPFPQADSYDYIRWTIEDTEMVEGHNADALTLFNAYGDRIATFYKWETVDAGDPS